MLGNMGRPCLSESCLALGYYHSGVDSWWIGTVSTLAGAVVGAGLQSWRDRVAYQRQMSVRWDEALLNGLAGYLGACDRSLRMFIQWRDERAAGNPNAMVAEVVAAFEAVHEKSHVITLLTGERSHPIRLQARRMREPLLYLRDDIVGGQRTDDATFDDFVTAHREARNALVTAAQGALGVRHDRERPPPLQDG